MKRTCCSKCRQCRIRSARPPTLPILIENAGCEREGLRPRSPFLDLRDVSKILNIMIALLLCVICVSCASRGTNLPVEIVATSTNSTDGAAVSAKPQLADASEMRPRLASTNQPLDAAAQTASAATQADANNAKLDLTVEESVLLAIRNNPSFKIEERAPAISRTFEREARAAFDPILNASASRSDVEAFQLSRTDTNAIGFTAKEDKADVSLDTFLPTGTKITLDGSADLTDSTFYPRKLAATRGSVTVSQSLLQGLGTGANLATLRQARLDTRISEYEFRAFALSFVAQVEETCWDYAFAESQTAIYRESVRLAEQQVEETSKRIEIGKLAEIDRAASQAELALRREALIDAENTLATTRLRLLRLLNPPGTAFWNRELVVKTKLDMKESDVDKIDEHIAVALKFRPDINQARLQIERSVLEVVKTRNGLLPKMDAFVTLGGTGYAQSFTDSMRNEESDGNDVTFGVTAQYPLGSRKERAGYKRAKLTRQSAADAMENLLSLVQVDVRSAYLEVNRSREQVNATRATRVLQKSKVFSEVEKFRIGKSTSLQVAQAQRDLVQSREDEVRAVAGYFKALVELYRLDGSLLDRRGIAAPGDKPIETSQK